RFERNRPDTGIDSTTVLLGSPSLNPSTVPVGTTLGELPDLVPSGEGNPPPDERDPFRVGRVWCGRRLGLGEGPAQVSACQNARGNGQFGGSLASSLSHAVDPPALGNAFELAFADVLEGQARSSHEVLHGLRDQDLGGTGQAHDAGADRDGDPSDLVVDQLALARVDTRTKLAT